MTLALTDVFPAGARGEEPLSAALVQSHGRSPRSELSGSEVKLEHRTVRRRRPVVWIMITLAFIGAAVVAFLTYDANRPAILDDASGDLSPASGPPAS